MASRPSSEIEGGRIEEAAKRQGASVGSRRELQAILEREIAEQDHAKGDTD